MQHQEGREATFSPVNFSKNWNHCFFQGRSCGQESYCLFNIVNDPCEQNNLASRLPGKVQELLETFSSYNNRTVEPLLCPPDQRADPVFWGNVWTNWEDMLDTPEGRLKFGNCNEAGTLRLGKGDKRA